MAFTDITGPEFWSQVVANVGGNPYYGEWDAIEERWSFIPTGANVQELRLSAKAAWQTGKKITRLQLTYLMVDPNPIPGAIEPVTFSDGGWFQTDVQGKTVATADALVSAPPDISTTGDSEETVLYRFNPLRTLRVFGPVYTDAADDYTIVETYITKIEAEIVDLPALTCSTFWVSRIQTYEQLSPVCDPQIPVGWTDITNTDYWTVAMATDGVWDGEAWRAYEYNPDPLSLSTPISLIPANSWPVDIRPSKLRITWEITNPGAHDDPTYFAGSVILYTAVEPYPLWDNDSFPDPAVTGEYSGVLERNLGQMTGDITGIAFSLPFYYGVGDATYMVFRVTKVEIYVP